MYRIALCALILGMSVVGAPTMARADDHSHRYYDRDARDWHDWNDREDRAYRQYLQEQHRQYRAWGKANSEQQRAYWRWRHQHPGNVWDHR
jgi:hypothetical protein